MLPIRTHALGLEASESEELKNDCACVAITFPI